MSNTLKIATNIQAHSLVTDELQKTKRKVDTKKFYEGALQKNQYSCRLIILQCNQITERKRLNILARSNYR